VSLAADWTGGRFFWANWDEDEFMEMKDEIVKKNELKLTLNGRPWQIEPVVLR